MIVGNASEEEISIASKEVSTSSEEADSLEEIEEIVNNDIEDTIGMLKKDYEELEFKIDTYEKYKANIKSVAAFMKTHLLFIKH